MLANILIELLQPRTDAGAITQWVIVLTLGPAAVIALVRRGHGDVARFVLGLVMIALAWFAIRAFH